MNRRLVAWMAMIGVMLSPVASRAEVTLVLADGTQINADKVNLREASRKYVLIQGASQSERSARDVVDVRAPKPAGFDTARGLAAQRKNLDQLVPVLEKMVEDHIGLRWDVYAAEMLAPIMVEQGRIKEAARLCERIIRAARPEWISIGLHRAYMDALVKSGSFGTVREKVAEMIASGHAPTAALGYVVRGDALKQQGKMEEALRDGYLRAVVLYSGVRDVHPEALAKAADALDRIKDPRAARLRQELMDRYPNSPYARAGIR